MNIERWLKAAIADAEQRGLPELKPLLEALAQATRALRAAGFRRTGASAPTVSIDDLRPAASGRRDHLGRRRLATVWSASSATTRA